MNVAVKLFTGVFFTFAFAWFGLVLLPHDQLKDLQSQRDEITGAISGLAVRGDPAMDDLQVASLTFTKAFAGPTVAGGTVDLEFTIENLGAGATASDISFSDDLDAVVSGLVATSLPPDGFCGGGSRLTGPTSQTHGVKTVVEITVGDVVSNCYPHFKGDAFGHHQLNTALHNPFF